MTPETEHIYLVQMLAAVEVSAKGKREAKQIALDTLAQRCARGGKDIIIRADEIKRQ